MARWPSGLRRHVKAVISSEAWKSALNI
ncbi:hypothetical protein VTP21DRAFT_3794 [Calcarisporiella thermophila]